MADCLRCRGACCEELILPASRDRSTNDFLQARGHGRRGPNRKWRNFTLEQRCASLSEDGMCSIYENRPLICAEYAPGGPACADAVRRRRPGMFDWIMGGADEIRAAAVPGQRPLEAEAGPQEEAEPEEAPGAEDAADLEEG